MSNIELYQPLLELSVALSECNQELQGKPGWRRKSELKKVIQNIEEKLTEQSAELINRSVDTWKFDHPLSTYLIEELNAVKEVADESRHVAIEDVKERLSKLADKETKKSPMRRKIEKNGWWLVSVAIGITMLSLKWYWLIDVNAPMESTAGVVQGAATLEKLLDYDASMRAQVRKGSWLKGIIFWPAEPTEEESKHASEFLWASVEVYDYLQKENALCNASLLHSPNDEGYKDEIVIAQIAINYVNDKQNIKGAESGPLLLANAYTTKFPCR